MADKVYIGIINKAIDKEYVGLTDEEIKLQVRSYKGLCTDAYVDEPLDNMVQALIATKAYLTGQGKAFKKGEELDDDSFSMIKGVTYAELKQKAGDFLERSDDGYYEFDPSVMINGLSQLANLDNYDEEEAEAFKKFVKYYNPKKLYKKLINFYKNCNPNQYHHNDEYLILTIRDPKEENVFKTTRLPVRFPQLVISIVVLTAALVVGLIVLPLTVKNGGWGFGLASIAVGFMLGSIVLKPFPILKLFKPCIWFITVWKKLDNWQKYHMKDIKPLLLVFFVPLFIIFFILAVVLTFAFGMLIGIALPILLGIILYIPYQLLGWFNKL